MRFSILLVAALAEMCTEGRLEAQADSVARRSRTGVIDGVVSDTSLAPLPAAVTSIRGTDIWAVTGPNGRFRITNVPAGDYTLLVRRLGFGPISARLQVVPPETLHVSFALERVVPTLDTVVSAAKWASPNLADFYERKRIGGGQFMTSEEIERRNSLSMSDLLRTFTGIAVRGKTVVSLRSPRCPVQVLLDGVPTAAFPALPDLSQLPSPKTIAAIEVYSGPASVPLQYKSISTCALIMIWTREGS